MDDVYLFIICVVYNKIIKEIASYDIFFKTSLDNSFVKFIVIDNSTDKEVIKSNTKTDTEIVYIKSVGNVGLSKAYNNALRYIDSQNHTPENIWVMLADDDTDFSENYLNNLIKAIKSINTSGNKCALVSTNIKSNSGCMSPFTIKGLSIKAFEGRTGNCYSNVYAINSGLCIKRSLLKTIGDYDEKMFLDYIDIYFFDRVRRTGYDGLLIIDGEISQGFSSVQRKNYENSKKRYLLFKRDFSYYCKSTKKSKLFWMFILLKRRINIMRSR